MAKVRPFSNENKGGIARDLGAALTEIARLRADNERIVQNNDRLGWVMLAAMEVVRAYTAGQPLSDQIDRLRVTLGMDKPNRVNGLQKAPEDT